VVNISGTIAMQEMFKAIVADKADNVTLTGTMTKTVSTTNTQKKRSNKNLT